ncbi:hypothetical protein CLV89_1319 [Tritonibacter scottomollicae]|uniref:Uncharacterized protein n=1 Tax=Tritonibacter scottomollicae TaxID=483013 RepID=A0A2T1A2T0_TRISK|nr:hypothetical protein CLV89_1319 [Tritonibacter scottomollicae]
MSVRRPFGSCILGPLEISTANHEERQFVDFFHHSRPLCAAQHRSTRALSGHAAVRQQGSSNFAPSSSRQMTAASPSKTFVPGAALRWAYTGGGERTLAASAKVPRQAGKSGHSSPRRAKPTCCAAHQRQQSADSDLCKVGGSGDMASDPCRMRKRKSWPSPHAQPPTTFERQGCGRKAGFRCICANGCWRNDDERPHVRFCLTNTVLRTVKVMMAT